MSLPIIIDYRRTSKTLTKFYCPLNLYLIMSLQNVMIQKHLKLPINKLKTKSVKAFTMRKPLHKKLQF